MTAWQRVQEATEQLPAPLAAVDVRALVANADDLVRRAGGTPIRIATKSVRCRAVFDRMLGRPGFAGLMGYSLPEAIWLVRGGARDVLVAYPTVDRLALAELVSDEALLSEITLMVDDPEHIAIIAAAVPVGSEPVRVCLDVDASLRVGPVHMGTRRSSVHSAEQAASAARRMADEPSVRLIGIMFYDAQVAGLPDSSADVRAMKKVSVRELRHRRPRVVEAVSRFATLELVNAGGTGSLGRVAADSCVTEVAAGSGLYGPTLFDGYRDFTPEPAFAYALDVTRRPAPDVRTLFSGGYVASGPTAATRQPVPWLPAGLTVLSREGVGEVQTPVRGEAAAALHVGDRVWWRHPKAGEVCERFTTLHLVEDDDVPTVTSVSTYRGEGQCFG